MAGSKFKIQDNKQIPNNQDGGFKSWLFRICSLLIIGNLALGACNTAICYAGDVRIEVTVDQKKIALGETAQLNVSFYGTQNTPVPKLDKIEGFDTRYLGPSTMVSIVNGAMSSSITHVYTLIPLKTGTFTIGPLSIEANGKTFTSNPIEIEVLSTPRAASAGQTAGPTEDQELKDRIFLVMDIPKRKIYLNEIIPVNIKLFVSQLGARDIQLPELQSDGFSVDKFGQPKQYREELGGILYDVVEFTAGIFGVKQGELVLGPARLKCNLAVRKQNRRQKNPFDDAFFGGMFEDFFDRYETYPLELKSAEIPVTVLPLPEKGKPVDFSGALGDFQLEVNAAPTRLKEGDPLTLKMAIKGAGNFDSINCPKLESEEGFKVYDPQSKTIDGGKEFEQILMPQSEKINHIPIIKFSFFNTQTGQYQTLSHGPIAINVSKSQEAQAKVVEPPSVPKYESDEELGKDIVYIKDSLGKITKKNSYLYDDIKFWIIQLAVFIFFIITLAFDMQRQKLRDDVRYARRLKAPAKARNGIKKAAGLLGGNKTEAFFDAVFKTIREYLADRFHLPSGGITAATIEDLAKEKKLNSEILDKIKSIFADCDMARYAPSQFGEAKMREILQSLKETIDYLEKQKI